MCVRCEHVISADFFKEEPHAQAVLGKKNGPNSSQVTVCTNKMNKATPADAACRVDAFAVTFGLVT